jgi:arylsulfatase A-like enzyme
MKTHFIAFAAINSLLFSTPVSAATAPMNVIFILADDLGWSDTTLNGTTRLYQTPNLDRLAKRGLTFSRAYSDSPLCSPTRASILTGLSVSRHGISSPNGHLPKIILEATVPTTGPPSLKTLIPNSVNRLETRYHTLGEAFKASGYATAHFGKWHLGIPPHSPLEHGFDTDLPHDSGPGPVRGFIGVWNYPKLKPRTPQEHIEDRMAEEAAKFIDANKDRPFFLNYWQFSVHAPFDAKKKLIAKYKELVKPEDPQRSPTYAAMVESMDDAVGTLLDSLERNGIADRTAIIFTSDNGGNMYNRIDDTSPTSNAPLRGGKATLWEGGIRVPCVVVWPGITRAGSRSEELVQTADFYPTIAELLDIKTEPGQHFDGISIAPALKGGKLERETLFTLFPHSPPIVPDQLPPGISVIQREWKLIRIFHDGENTAHRHLLFNLKNDLGETTDLAERHPEQVKTMVAILDKHLADTAAVVPKPNPAWRKTTENPSWTASKGTALKTEENRLILTSSSSDPWISKPINAGRAKGPYTISFRMTSNGAGAGQIMWQESAKQPFNGKQRSVSFEPSHDGIPKDYRLDLPPANIAGIRIDPGTAMGEYSFENIRIIAGGREVFSWPPLPSKPK